MSRGAGKLPEDWDKPIPEALWPTTLLWAIRLDVRALTSPRAIETLRVWRAALQSSNEAAQREARTRLMAVGQALLGSPELPDELSPRPSKAEDDSDAYTVDAFPPHKEPASLRDAAETQRPAEAAVAKDSQRSADPLRARDVRRSAPAAARPGLAPAGAPSFGTAPPTGYVLVQPSAGPSATGNKPPMLDPRPTGRPQPLAVPNALSAAAAEALAAEAGTVDDLPARALAARSKDAAAKASAKSIAAPKNMAAAQDVAAPSPAKTKDEVPVKNLARNAPAADLLPAASGESADLSPARAISNLPAEERAVLEQKPALPALVQPKPRKPSRPAPAPTPRQGGLGRPSALRPRAAMHQVQGLYSALMPFAQELIPLAFERRSRRFWARWREVAGDHGVRRPVIEELLRTSTDAKYLVCELIAEAHSVDPASVAVLVEKLGATSNPDTSDAKRKNALMGAAVKMARARPQNR